MNRAILKRTQILTAVEHAANEGRLSEITVGEVMTRGAICVAPQASAVELVQLFQKNGFRHLLVAEGERLVGVVSDRDVIRLMGKEDFQHREQWDEFAARDLMCDQPRTVRSRTLLVDAVRLIAEHGINCLPVVEAETVVGILTATDLYLALEQVLTVTAAQSVCDTKFGL